MTRQPSNELRLGRRAIEGLDGVNLLKDLFTIDGQLPWVLSCQLTHSAPPSEFVPQTTEWFVLIDPDYPFGSIEFHPSKENSIERTFPHQAYNDAGSPKLPWRAGKICLNTPFHALDRDAWDEAPRNAESRLLWYFERSLEWLHAAAKGQLVMVGDAFELPAFPTKVLLTKTLIFSETDETFRKWSVSTQKLGTFTFKPLKLNGALAVVTSFKYSDGEAILTSRWGSAITDDSALEQSGLWLRFEKVPVFNPWHAPNTWDELRQLCKEEHAFDLDTEMRQRITVLRQNPTRLLAIGFPIPSVVGQNAVRFHWQAIEVPKLCDGRSQVNGFPKNERGFWGHDRAVALQGSRPLEWLASQNWAADQLRARGALPNAVAERSFLLIGAGAVGSMVADILVRSGVHRVSVIDFDLFNAGNLGRHTLTLSEVGGNKAEQLAKQLNRSSPNVHVEAISDMFPPRTDAGQKAVSSCDVMIDCTADDEVLWHLSKSQWPSPKWIFSVSTGLGAKRLFLFCSHPLVFPVDAFRFAIEPWLMDELHSYDREGLPREGIGCWHPIFPARIDDLWMLAGLAVKEFTRRVENDVQETELVVWGREIDADGVAGVSRLKEVPCRT